MTVKYNDYPLHDIAQSVQRLINDGATVYQKFTCDKCGSRQTIEEPNRLFASGTCEACGHTTDIVKRGCNYMVHYKIALPLGHPDAKPKKGKK
jgi:hypothetical protein